METSIEQVKRDLPAKTLELPSSSESRRLLRFGSKFPVCVVAGAEVGAVVERIHRAHIAAIGC